MTLCACTGLITRPSAEALDGGQHVTDPDGAAAPSSDAAPPGTSPGAYFPAGSAIYADISAAPLARDSAAVIEWLDSVGGWGTGGMNIDFSIEVLSAEVSVAERSFIPTDDHFSPDCDTDDIPVPPDGALEGESGYACDGDGDCHLIVVQPSTQRLFEMWRGNIEGDTFYGGCLAVWDMSRLYGPEGRGMQCTSADAAGLPIAPLLFTATEVAAGSIDHALRFILPNSRIRRQRLVPPATHATDATSGPVTAPPYGARLRLRADFPMGSLPSDGARVVARAMQRYGIILADGGSVPLTAQSDRFTGEKWADVLGPFDVQDIRVSDFEMIDAGEPIVYTGDCERIF